MINKTNKSASGTSFHGDVINATYNQLVACFGEPTYINGIQDKSQYDWVLGYKNAFVFTVYDWKEYKHIRPDDMISWHIGATEPEYSTIALEAVNKVLHGYYIDTDMQEDEVGGGMRHCGDDYYDYDWEFDDITEPATDSAGFNKFDKADEIVAMLKSIDVDGETMEYIIRQVGMEEQMSRQLVYNKIMETECDCGHCGLDHGDYI